MSETPPSLRAGTPGAPAGLRRGLRWAWWAGGAAAVALVVIVLVLLLWPGTVWWVEHVDGVKLNGKSGLTGKDRQEVLDNARGRITAVATGILAAVAIYYTAKNARSARQTAAAAQESVQAALRSADHNEAAQRRTHELTERGQLTERFTAAVAQLGDNNPAIQLGGVHALAGIADDAPRTLRQTCIDVLCAYLRLPYDPDPGTLDDNQQNTLTAKEREADQQRRTAYRGLREVRHTIFRIIGNRLRADTATNTSWQGHDFDFTDVVFDGGDLHGTDFTGGQVSFSGATFAGGMVDFSGATFSGGRVAFVGATFAGGEVDFGDATFSGGQVSFRDATFSGGQISFRDATFSGGQVSFGGATFSGSELFFVGSTFSSGRVIFGDTTFSGGTLFFMNATFSGGQVSFGGATFSGGQLDFVGPATRSGSQVDFWAARGARPAGLLEYAATPPPGVRLPTEWLAPGNEGAVS